MWKLRRRSEIRSGFYAGREKTVNFMINLPFELYSERKLRGRIFFFFFGLRNVNWIEKGRDLILLIFFFFGLVRLLMEDFGILLMGTTSYDSVRAKTRRSKSTFVSCM